jgi:hypothetical protein
MFDVNDVTTISELHRKKIHGKICLVFRHQYHYCKKLEGNHLVTIVLPFISKQTQ